MNEQLLNELKDKLTKEADALKKELGSFASKDKKIEGNWNTKYPNREDGDREEEADEVQEYENMLSVEHSLESKLKDVNSALEKIKNGAYGKCEKCEKDIEEERLQAMPEAKLCVNCNK